MNWREFELHVERYYLGADFPRWSRVDHPNIDVDGIIIPDFYLIKGRGIRVADCKYRQRLSNADVEQLIRYMIEVGANGGVIYIASDTAVSEDVENYAKENNIEIRRTRISLSHGC